MQAVVKSIMYHSGAKQSGGRAATSMEIASTRTPPLTLTQKLKLGLPSTLTQKLPRPTSMSTHNSHIEPFRRDDLCDR